METNTENDYYSCLASKTETGKEHQWHRMVQRKQICYLQHSTITQGVWSLHEKPIDKEKIVAEELQNEEVLFQKVSFAAIKEAIGVCDNDIVILERHLAYSLLHNEMHFTSQYS